MSESLKLSFSTDGFATIQMDNGENRFRTPIILAWNKLLDQVLAKPDTKGLFITGTGKFFSNGIDLAWLAQNRDDARDFMDKLHEFLSRVLVLSIPTVALINGHAFGGGAFLALACDFRIMTPVRGWLNWPETALGMRFGDPLLKLARAKIPPGHVQREALLFAKRLTAEHARSLGLVDEVVEESKMEETGKRLVNEALGRNGLGRQIVYEMKKDIYGQELDLSKL